MTSRTITSALPTSLFIQRRQRLRHKQRSQTASVLILVVFLVVIFLPRHHHHHNNNNDILADTTGGGGGSSTAVSQQEKGISQRQLLVAAAVPVPTTAHHPPDHYHAETRRRQAKSNSADEDDDDDDNDNDQVVAGDFGDYSCEDVYRYPPSVRCAYAHTCNGGDGIVVTAVFCQENNKNEEEINTTTGTTLLLLGIYSVTLLLLLIVLFRILGSTAEEFFSPGLEMLSVKLHVPERFAGVTLLSLGNGAPDVASTVSALLHDRKRGYLLALGELTGAAMVASTLIVGAVVACSTTPVSVGTALVRDVVFFMITMFTVYLCFNDGSITQLEIQIMGGLYVGYVLIVLVADIYQRRVVVMARRQKQQEQIGPSEDAEQQQPSETSPLVTMPSTQLVRENIDRGLSIGTYELQRQKSANEKKSWHRGDSWKTEMAVPMMHRTIRYLSNYENLSAGQDHDGKQDIAAENQDSRKVPSSVSRLPGLSPFSSGWGDVEEDGTDPLMVFHPHHGGMVDLKQTERGRVEAVGRNACRELTKYLQTFWNESFRSDEYNVVDKFLMLCELPITILRMLTIPVPCDGYYCRPLLALSIALCPVWLWYYFRAQFDIYIEEASFTVVLLSFLLPALIAVLVFQFAPNGDAPPRLSVAVPITMVGFVASAAWLDYLADKIVRLLEFFGIICGIPSTIMGLTVLAWGNSSQDLIANMTVAKKGLSTMAVTASFAGPVFNMLVGLCIGLSLLKSAKPGKELVVHLDTTLRVGFFYCILNGILVIISGVCIGKGVIPKKYGIVAAVVYFSYVVASLAV